MVASPHIDHAEQLDALWDSRVLAIVRSRTPQEAVTAADLLFTAGIRVLEVSLVTPDALDAIAELRARHPQALLGVGTVTTTEHVRSARSAGASFIVSAVSSEDVLAFAARRELPVLPGALTPTEIHRAAELGASGVKLFPASAVGPGYVREVLATMPDLRLVAVGGITPASAPEWLRAGARAVGLGSALTSELDPATARSRVDELSHLAGPD
jgi:2-dehydro-3-deoxyphosphogluconate aldolase/(4S)-4-hydroxy-2-oxoglutarate aldolase